MALKSFVFLILLGTVSAMRWPAPEKTIAPTSTANWSPIPTNDRSRLAVLELFKRGNAFPNTVCGWVGGKIETPATCSTRSSCAWNSDNHIVGCCATSNNVCKFYTSCIDLNSPKQAGDSDEMYTCKGSSACYRNTYPGGYYQWGCGYSNWATNVETSFAGMKDISLQIVITGNAAQNVVTSVVAASSMAIVSVSTILTVSATNPPDTTSIANIGVTATGAEPTGSGLSASPTNTSSLDNSPNTGAIAGGVIGGVAGLLIVAALIFFCRRKRWFRTSVADTPPTLFPPGIYDPGMYSDHHAVGSYGNGSSNGGVLLYDKPSISSPPAEMPSPMPPSEMPSPNIPLPLNVPSQQQYRPYRPTSVVYTGNIPQSYHELEAIDTPALTGQTPTSTATTWGPWGGSTVSGVSRMSGLGGLNAVDENGNGNGTGVGAKRVSLGFSPR